MSNECVICGKVFYAEAHKCDESGYRRSMGAKQAAITRQMLKRYGNGETFGDKLCAAANFRGDSE